MGACVTRGARRDSPRRERRSAGVPGAPQRLGARAGRHRDESDRHLGRAVDPPV